ncbi:MAG: hypothetical protein Athens101410_423 [Parcubacteria group bacterium Athens1014_10]|nr:MAG: hypothetical protein Athens101410_423 [Parcubacteria group bacterium Athens1014_10]TSD05502.1 MAG: hypothetical protein Athens071412_312 [Parcubacteria group bacterium Athens0714_12]
MNKNSLDKIIKLIQRTGDKIIVVNEGEPCLVMMGFKEYEKLAFSKDSFKDLTKEELIDKINKEIAFYKEEQEEKKIEANNFKNLEEIEKEEVRQDYEIEPIK